MSQDFGHNFQTRISCSLNKSTSKASYSFSRQIRFKDNKYDNYYHFYNLPDLKTKRGTFIGYGKRFAKGTGAICSGLYGFPSSFDPNQHNSPQYSFGLNNKKMRRNNSCGPGPIYDTRTNLGNFGPHYSVGKSVKNKVCKTSEVPGVGNYDLFEKKPVGMYTLSKYKNSTGIFLGTTTKRFPKETSTASPGPVYKLPSLFGQTKIYESKYKSCPGISISGRKESLYKFNRYSSSPGPGAYDRFSEFESFETKTKVKN